MRKILILSLIALTSATASAQMSVKDSIAAAKAAAKAEKVRQAEDLKAFKAKQAKELKDFIERQKSGSKMVSVETPALTNEADTVAYIYGISQSRGLRQYAASQLGIEDFDEFVRGILETTSKAGENSNDFTSGLGIGGQVLQMGNNISKDYYAADPEKKINAKIIGIGLVQGLYENASMPLDSASQKLQKIMSDRKAANEEILYGANRKAGEKFLEDNKKAEGVVTLPSGLQYKVIVEGDQNSEKAKKMDKVKVNYEGRLIDGTVFDSSYKRGQPATFTPSQVIKGWTEALMLMPVGAKWELYIPYQLGYGAQGSGGQIKPYSALVFTVELIENETATQLAKEKAEKEEKAAEEAKNTAKKKK